MDPKIELPMQGTAFSFGEYDYVVPGELNASRPAFELASNYLDLYDQLVERWRTEATPERKTDANGVLLALGDRSREALRSCQVLTGHRQYRDAIQVIRPVVEASIYAAYLFSDPAQIAARVSQFCDYQAVERQRTLEALKSIPQIAKLEPELRHEIEGNYSQVESAYEGTLFRKTPFGCTFWKLAEQSNMEWLYRTAYNHASAYSHITVGSLAVLPPSLHDLGLGVALATFPVLFRIMDSNLTLGADPTLATLETRTVEFCNERSKVRADSRSETPTVL